MTITDSLRLIPKEDSETCIKILIIHKMDIYIIWSIFIAVKHDTSISVFCIKFVYRICLINYLIRKQQYFCTSKMLMLIEIFRFNFYLRPTIFRFIVDTISIHNQHNQFSMEVEFFQIKINCGRILKKHYYFIISITKTISARYLLSWREFFK